MRRRMNWSIAAGIVAVLMVSCERRPLSDQVYNVYLDLKIEDDIVNYPLDEHDEWLPERMKVNFYDPQTGTLEHEDYVKPQGGYLNVPPGNWHMIVYSFDYDVQESTPVRNEGSHADMEAYTNEISDFQKGQLSQFLAMRAEMYATKNGEMPQEKIKNQPEHLFVAREMNVEIPVQVDSDDGPFRISTTAGTVVETYTIEVHDVIGAQYISSVSAIISGMVESHFLGRNEKSDVPVSLFMDLDVNGTSLSGKFNTFGKFPGAESELIILDLLVTDTGGGEHLYHKDVTDQFRDNDSQHIQITDRIEVEEPENSGGGGLAPDVDDWDDGGEGNIII